MKYNNLGNTGLKVSELCLGCMTFGVPERGDHPWTLPEEQSRPLIRQAVDAGINYFDTANAYSDGTSEEIVGRALKEFIRRDEAVIATKVFFPMHPGPNGSGLSRKAIFDAIDASLRRLGTDYIDLYQIHRWDYSTPIEETLEALNDVVRSGKARYLGASSMHAWQFSKALHLARQHGWTPFVSMQNHYNLLYREEEREMMPLCIDERIAVVPWSPLARGRLTRAVGHRDGANADRRVRQQTLRIHDRGRPQGRRTSRDDCRRPRSTERPGCTGLGCTKALRYCAHHRCFETPTSHRRRRRPEPAISTTRKSRDWSRPTCLMPSSDIRDPCLRFIPRSYTRLFLDFNARLPDNPRLL